MQSLSAVLKVVMLMLISCSSTVGQLATAGVTGKCHFRQKRFRTGVQHKQPSDHSVALFCKLLRKVQIMVQAAIDGVRSR